MDVDCENCWFLEKSKNETFFDDVFIYLKVSWKERERKWEWISLPSAGLFHKWMQWLERGWAKAMAWNSICFSFLHRSNPGPCDMFTDFQGALLAGGLIPRWLAGTQGGTYMGSCLWQLVTTLAPKTKCLRRTDTGTQNSQLSDPCPEWPAVLP